MLYSAHSIDSLRCADFTIQIKNPICAVLLYDVDVCLPVPSMRVRITFVESSTMMIVFRLHAKSFGGYHLSF